MQPVYLRLSLRTGAGTVKCCDHALFVCLPETCRCCRNFASYTINVVDMSDYVTRRSSDDVSIDSTLLHDRVHAHDPYTPESSNSRTPLTDDAQEEEEEHDIRRSSVSPTELKSKLENYITGSRKEGAAVIGRLSAKDDFLEVPLGGSGEVVESGVILSPEAVSKSARKSSRRNYSKCCSLA